jgi:hypothetical protein
VSKFSEGSTIHSSFFHCWDRWFARQGKADLLDKAKEIGNLIAALESKLEVLPAPLYDFLFTPPWARGSVMPSSVFGHTHDL